MAPTTVTEVDRLARQALSGDEIERQLAVSILRNMIVAGLRLNASTLRMLDGTELLQAQFGRTALPAPSERAIRARARWSAR